MTARMLTEATGDFAYQTIGEDYVAEREWAALQWGFSTGKTRVVLTRLVRDPRIDYTLMFCRLDNVSDLMKEIKKHSTLDVVELTGGNADVRYIVERFSRCVRTQRTKCIFLANYAKARYLEEELKALQPTAVVCDESTNIKHHTSAQSKAVYAIGHMPQVVFRCCMAGKMAPQGLSDYWGQLFFLDKGKTLGSSFYWFENNYYVKMGYDKVLKPGMRDKLIKLISDNTSIMRTNDVRVPKRVNRVLRTVDVTPEQRNYLAQIAKGAVMTPKHGVWPIDNGAIAAEKESQICAGYIKWPEEPYGDGTMLELRTNPKLDLLVSLLEDELADHNFPDSPKIVIWAFHTKEIEMISAALTKLKWSHVLLHGKQTQDQNTRAKSRFLEDPLTRVLIGQSDMGIGTNDLIVADTCIWMSNGNKIESRDQAESRLDRPGQRSNILNYIDIVVKEQRDHAVALAVGYAKMDVDGFMGTAKLMQVAKQRAKEKGAVFP